MSVVVVSWSLCGACCSRFVVCCPLLEVRRSLLVVVGRCLLFVVRYALSVVCCLLAVC